MARQKPKAAVWSTARASYVVPATVSTTTGMATTVSYMAAASEDASQPCYVQTNGFGYGWLLTKITNAALGLPANPSLPLKLL